MSTDNIPEDTDPAKAALEAAKKSVTRVLYDHAGGRWACLMPKPLAFAIPTIYGGEPPKPLVVSKVG
jgi:hypothetical protein